MSDVDFLDTEYTREVAERVYATIQLMALPGMRVSIEPPSLLPDHTYSINVYVDGRLAMWMYISPSGVSIIGMYTHKKLCRTLANMRVGIGNEASLALFDADHVNILLNLLPICREIAP